MNDNGSNDIAIIGMACVLPGAPDARTYWENILHKVNAISDTPPEWEAELFYEQDTKADDRTYCKRGGFLGNLAHLDPFSFGILRNLKQLHPVHTESELAEIKRQIKAGLPPFHSDTSAGLVPNIITGRIANRLDLMGPNYLIDAACASSLVAIEMAARELRTGNCDLALAGGVN